MNRHYATLVLFTSLATGVASAETLLVDHARQEPGAMPTRGMSMAQVEAKFGAPNGRLDPRGGQKRQWPTINRWQYPNFVVYFEKSKVIDSVASSSAPLAPSAEMVPPPPPISSTSGMAPPPPPPSPVPAADMSAPPPPPVDPAGTEVAPDSQPPAQ